MPGIGPMELIVVLIIALLILGPKRLPAAGRSLGHGITEFRAGLSGKGAESAALVERPATVAAPPAAGSAEQARAGEERPSESPTSP